MKNIFLLIMIAIVGVFTLDVYLPGMQSMADQFNVDISKIADTFTVFSIVFAFMQLFHGTLSDFIGRKPVIVSGLALAAIATIVCIYADNYQTLFVARIVQALGISSFVVINAIVRDIYTGVKAIQVRSRVIMTSGISISVAPTIGGLLHQKLNWQGGFIASLVLILITLMVALFFYQENHINRSANKSLQHIKESYVMLVSDKQYLSHAIIAMLSYSVHFSFIVLSSNIFMNHLGMSPLNFGYLMIVYGGVYFISGLLTSRLAKKLSMTSLIHLGSCLIGIGGLILGLIVSIHATGVWQILMPITMMTMGMTNVRTAATTAALAPFPNQAGQGAAGINLIQFSVAALIATMLNKINMNHESSLALLGVVSAISIIYLLKRLENENTNRDTCSV